MALVLEGPVRLNSSQPFTIWCLWQVGTDWCSSSRLKEFDIVLHDSLLSKLAHYGNDKNIWQWISSFLKGCKQSVIVDGKSTGFWCTTRHSASLFVFLHINDLISVVNSKARPFADDCLIYRKIKTIKVIGKKI